MVVLRQMQRSRSFRLTVQLTIFTAACLSLGYLFSAPRLNNTVVGHANLDHGPSNSLPTASAMSPSSIAEPTSNEASREQLSNLDPGLSKEDEQREANGRESEENLASEEKSAKSIIPTELIVQGILNPQTIGVERLSCPAFNRSRYTHLQPNNLSVAKAKFFFALDLFEIASLLPGLMGAVIQAIEFLGPENCVVSVVEGRSKDNTYAALKGLMDEAKRIGFEYHLVISDINPNGEGDRIEGLAKLRNLALEPLLRHPESYSPDTTVIFLNDVVPCEEDILELLHQMVIQKADMTCAMDWIYGGSVFYDVWVSRGINGDTFFEIPQDGSWGFSDKLFWSDSKTRKRLNEKQPFQVYACWNGLSVFKAEPLLQHGVKFRMSKEGECYMGEPTLLCKDFWTQGYGRIAVVPSVNVAYNHEETKKVKVFRGYAHEGIRKANQSDIQELIQWRKEPPAQVKCAKTWSDPYWVAPV